MKTETLTFSVIIPCYNAGRWIARALHSVAAQTYTAHEIIVIDDGSTDDSIEQIWASGVKVHLLTTTRANGAGARNAGIAAASGDWIALLDADDIWYPNHLERAATLLSDSSDVAFMSAHDWIDLEDNVIPIPSGFKCDVNEPTSGLSDARFLQVLSNGLHFGHSTVVYQRARLMEVGCFDVEQRRRHDIDLWLRMVHGHTWAYDTVKSVGYREGTPGSISRELIDCEYYYLRALLKNSTLYPGEGMQKLIHTSARRGMGLAFVDGNPREFRQAVEIGWPYLEPSFRAFYQLVTVCPPLFRWLLRVRRRIIWGKAAQ
jgi:glycosyltransferase involved in cell wall biosynthesis